MNYLPEHVEPDKLYDVALDLLAKHIWLMPTEGGNGNRDDWNDQVDEVLAQLRADLIAIGYER